MALQNKNLSSASSLLILQALLPLIGITRNKFSAALLKTKVQTKSSIAAFSRPCSSVQLCSNALRKDLKVCAENSISHPIDTAALSKKLICASTENIPFASY